MDEILVATPLRNEFSRSYSFLDGVTIQKISPILWELSVAKRLMSDDEREQVSEARYSVCASKEIDSWQFGHEDRDIYERARRAMYTLQIIHPSGGHNVYLKFRKTPTGFDNIGSQHSNQMRSTLIGRLGTVREDELQTDFETVYKGVNRAFNEKIVRLQNPILLLEHGLQINHVYLSTLTWVMGLDMLFMAGNKASFTGRITGFLGRNTLVFPSIPYSNRQPQLTVGEVAGDVYELRNIVAHGREIPSSPFREKRDILDERGDQINADDYSYAAVLWEAALFLLVKSVRKIMLGGFIDRVADESVWKRTLKIESRLEQQRALTSL